jgi:hypothetical protein
MSATPPDGAAALCPALPEATPLGRKRPVTIPWREVACRLAEGARPGAIAADLGLQEERIWRHLRKSLRFRFYLRQAMERQRLLSGLQLATLGQTALLARGLQPDSLDGELLRLLNEAADRQEPETDLVQQIENLSKTGEPPPNMAFRRRLAEEKQRMDLQMEVWRAQDAVRAAGATAAVAEPQRTATKASEPERTETKPNEHQRSETNPNEHRRSETNANEHERTAAKAVDVPPGPRLRPSAPRAEPSPYAVVDLDGPDLRRLRAAGLLGPARTTEGTPDS